MKKTRVMIVDDHPVVRFGLRELLAADPALEVCGDAVDAGPALDMLRRENPELAIVDVSLPSGSGLDLVKRGRAECANTRFLVVSMHDDAIFAERALRAGAMGYINKSRPADELLDAVHKVLRGEISVSGATSDRLVRRAVGGESSQVAGIESLTDREVEIFEMLGQGRSVREISESLHLSVKTVETHRDHVRKKLGLRSASEVVRHAALWAGHHA